MDKKQALYDLMFDYLVEITDTDHAVSDEAVKSVPEIAKILIVLLQS